MSFLLSKDGMKSFQAAARKKHIHFSFDSMPDTDYHTLADMEKLERIYFNLLSNAFKFTPENGKIAVRLSSLSKEDKRWIRFTVANTGSMISAEHIRNVFDRFDTDSICTIPVRESDWHW